MTPFSGPVALKALLQNKEGKVLVCLNNHPGEPWDLPGGTLNAGEHPYDALVREVKEELNLDITVVGAVAADHFIKPTTGKQTVVVALHATLVQPDAPIVLADGEIIETRWIGSDELDVVPLFPEYRRFLERFFTR
jgi:8-oxo-dGTP pyrophosphatase MutT (NUDIX family)